MARPQDGGLERTRLPGYSAFDGDAAEQGGQGPLPWGQSEQGRRPEGLTDLPGSRRTGGLMCVAGACRVSLEGSASL